LVECRARDGQRAATSLASCLRDKAARGGFHPNGCRRSLQCIREIVNRAGARNDGSSALVNWYASLGSANPPMSRKRAKKGGSPAHQASQHRPPTRVESHEPACDRRARRPGDLSPTRRSVPPQAIQVRLCIATLTSSPVSRTPPSEGNST